MFDRMASALPARQEPRQESRKRAGPVRRLSLQLNSLEIEEHSTDQSVLLGIRRPTSGKSIVSFLVRLCGGFSCTGRVYGLFYLILFKLFFNSGGRLAGGRGVLPRGPYYGGTTKHH